MADAPACFTGRIQQQLTRPTSDNSRGGRCQHEAWLRYGANNAIRDVKEQANLDQRFPMTDERSVRSRYALQRLSRVAVFAGMAGAAETHSRLLAEARTGQEILQTQSERLIQEKSHPCGWGTPRKRERVAGKRGRSSIESSTSQTSANVAMSIGLASCHDTLYYWVPVDGVNCSFVAIVKTGLTQIEDDRNRRHTRPIKSRWGTGALMWQDNPQQAVGYPCQAVATKVAPTKRRDRVHCHGVGATLVATFHHEQSASHIKACQPDGMYQTARATWPSVPTDSLTTAKYEHVLDHNGYCSASY
jgi:hypothetical protein